MITKQLTKMFLQCRFDPDLLVHTDAPLPHRAPEMLTKTEKESGFYKIYR